MGVLKNDVAPARRFVCEAHWLHVGTTTRRHRPLTPESAGYLARARQDLDDEIIMKQDADYAICGAEEFVSRVEAALK